MVERRIRYSQLSKFKRCRRSWLMEYVRGLELARDPEQTKGARDIGSIVHALIEAYYNGEDWRVALEALRINQAQRGWSTDWADVFEMARIMMEGYVEWLSTEGADANESVVMVEPQLEAEIGVIRGDRIILTGKPDRVAYDELAETFIVEDTKTTNQIESVLIHGGQGLTYSMLLKMQHGIDVGLFRTNQLRKVKRTSRANPPFYGRAEMTVNPTMLRNHFHHVVGTLDTMVDLMQHWEKEEMSDPEAHHRLFYPNPTKECSWDCDFLAVCKTMDDGSNFEHAIRNYYRPKEVTA